MGLCKMWPPTWQMILYFSISVCDAVLIFRLSDDQTNLDSDNKSCPVLLTPRLSNTPSTNPEALWRDLWALAGFPAYQHVHTSSVYGGISSLTPLFGGLPKWKFDIFTFPYNSLVRLKKKKSLLSLKCTHGLISKWLTELWCILGLLFVLSL